MVRLWESWAAYALGGVAGLCTVVAIIGGALKVSGGAAGVADWLCPDFWFPLTVVLLLFAIGLLVHARLRTGPRG